MAELVNAILLLALQGLTQNHREFISCWDSSWWCPRQAGPPPQWPLLSGRLCVSVMAELTMSQLQMLPTSGSWSHILPNPTQHGLFHSRNAAFPEFCQELQSLPRSNSWLVYRWAPEAAQLRAIGRNPKKVRAVKGPRHDLVLRAPFKKKFPTLGGNTQTHPYTHACVWAHMHIHYNFKTFYDKYDHQLASWNVGHMLCTDIFHRIYFISKNTVATY